MKEIEVPYIITIYDFSSDPYTTKVIKGRKCFDGNELFPKIIKDIVREHSININEQIYIENLKEITWGKIISKKLLYLTDGDSFHYNWFQYKLKDIQEIFNLFNQEINIVVNGFGVGGGVGELEGIKFYINSNEKDRHEHDPHIHCKYSGETTRIRIDNQELMKDEKEFKNPKKMKIAKKWIKDNKEDLLKAYNALNQIENNSICLTAEI